MAYAIITQVAERIPEKIEKFVFIAAVLVKNSGGVIEAMQRNPDGELLPELAFVGDQSSSTAPKQTWCSKAFRDVKEGRILQTL